MTFARWLHASIDDAMLLFGALTQSERGFAKTPESKPPGYQALYNETIASSPRIHWDRVRRRRGPARVWQRVPIEIPRLETETCLDFWVGRGEHSDTLVVHHHGLREFNHTLLPHALALQSPLSGRCDWVALKAPFHRSAREATELMACRNRFMRTIATSVVTARLVRERFAGRYRRVILSGVSLGGLVALGNAAFDGGFDAYLPIVSGPDLADVLFRSSFSRIFKRGFLRREQRRSDLRHLDLAHVLEGRMSPPIRALLGRYDRIFRLEPQLRAYSRIPSATVEVVDRGHLSAPGSLALIANHLRAVIDELEQGTKTKSTSSTRNKASHVRPRPAPGLAQSVA